jgi:hypothetical protein
MKKLKASWGIALILMTVSSGFAKSLGPQDSKSRTALELAVQNACREAVLELKFRRESEETLKKQVEELKALSTAKDERIFHLEAAIAKYEAAVLARTQAETFVAELRSNYEKQIALAEKQLAIEQGRTSMWRTLAKIGLFTGVLVGGVLGYALGHK